jgi:NAD-dependent dihydropyrimidine dehydrogenase PreA subunit
MHRYASDAAVIFGLLHGWRTFFQDRFRGPRWLAWVTGVGMAVVVWAIGITGYWLIWDDRAQILNQSLFKVLGNFKGGQTFIVDFIVGDAAGTGWVFMMIVIVLHLGLSALVGYFLWLHLKRMSRAKWLPPKYWMVISIIVLLLSAALFPLGMLPPLSATQLPSKPPLTYSIYFIYPPSCADRKRSSGACCSSSSASSPHCRGSCLARKKLEPIKVDLANCDGCTLCERDCPYLAIKMIPRTDGARPKFQADIDPNFASLAACALAAAPIMP